MSDNAEKRCRAAMDKLFLPSSSPRPSTRFGKEPSADVTKNFAESARSELNARARKRKTSMAPTCRPWDRGDLVRRLASFKSMTWFAKPKVINPVNCARRGWINVDVDTLACEVCDSRLLFSTPSSWTTQQVENSAAVFSLKLDSKHKTSCPWKDNICDEHLAQFPPTPPAVLVESFRERYKKLACLSALPIVSSAATEYMKGPQIDRFLERTPPIFLTLNSRDGSYMLQQKDLEEKSAATASEIYYKAQKLISLCGWEPRVLPYVVDCEDHIHSVENLHDLETSRKNSNAHSPNLSVCDITGVNKVVEPEENSSFVEDQDVDPASVVLDCKLCGACVGLWTFSTVQKPLQLFNLIKSPDKVKNQDTKKDDSVSEVSDIANISVGCDDGKENIYGMPDIVLTTGKTATQNRGAAGLNLTIAGGPPPTKQTFRPLVSLPIISRNLRAGIWSSSDVRTNLISLFDEENQHKSQSELPTQSGTDELENAHGVEVAILATSKCDRDGTVSLPTAELSDGYPIIDQCCRVIENSFKHDECTDALTSGETHLPDCVPSADTVNSFCSEKTMGPVQGVVGDAGNGKTWDQGTADVSATTNKELNFRGAKCHSIQDNCQASKDGERSIMPSTDVTIVTNQVQDAIQGAEGHVSKSSLETIDSISDPHHSLIAISQSNGHLTGDNNQSGQEKSPSSANDASVEGNRYTSLQVSNKYNVGAYPATSLELIPWEKSAEFDPIRQHRHFCAWITSSCGVGRGVPGWQQALFALEQAESAACHVSSPQDSPSISSKYEGEDPVALLRKLLKSGSSAKRLRRSHE